MQTALSEAKPSRAAKRRETDSLLVRDFDKLPPSRLLTASAVAQICGIHLATVWFLTKRGELPQPVRIGRSTRWRAGDVRLALGGVK